MYRICVSADPVAETCAAVDHADCTASTWRHELDDADEECIYLFALEYLDHEEGTDGLSARCETVTQPFRNFLLLCTRKTVTQRTFCTRWCYSYGRSTSPKIVGPRVL